MKTDNEGYHDPKSLRANMVELLTNEGVFPTASCRQAVLSVPRHCFVPNVSISEAYMDKSVVTHREGLEGPIISSSSQPSMMTKMLGQLRLRPGVSVLEIGTGTGYNAALLAEVVGAKYVTSLELDSTIAAEARDHLNTAGYHDVCVVNMDGCDGYAENAPYDRIIVTAGVNDLSPMWINQLKENGIIVVPLSFQCVQIALALRKRGHKLVSKRNEHCSFMDLRGKRARTMYHNHAAGLLIIRDKMDELSLDICHRILNEKVYRIDMSNIFGIKNSLHNFLCFIALAYPFTVQILDARLGTHGMEGLVYAIVDLEQRQLVAFDPYTTGSAVCFGGLEIGTKLNKLCENWFALAQPEIERLAFSVYFKDGYPVRYPPARPTSGLFSKDQTLVEWAYL